MADFYWVTGDADGDFHNGNNWSASSGGAGGVGVPQTSTDHIHFDGNGYILCSANASITVGDVNLEAGMTELFLTYQSGIVHGDVIMDDGYFAQLGEDTVEFKGNLTYNGGTWTTGSVGGEATPHTLLSGTGKTVTNTTGSNIMFERLTITGTYTTAGARLRTFLVNDEIIDISGTLTIASGNEVAIIDGGTWSALTGTVTGAGNFEYEMNASATMPTTGTIDCDVELELFGSPTLAARTWGGDIELIIVADSLTLTMGAGKHYTEQFQIVGDDASITTGFTLDYAANNAEHRCNGKWFVKIASFNQPSQFTLKWGDGTHIFNDEFQLGLFGGGVASDMDTQAGDSTIILHPTKNQTYTYRMSRIKGGFPGRHDTQTYNKVFFLRSKSDFTTSVRFIEGFNAPYFRIEWLAPVNSLIRGTNTGAILARKIDVDKLVIVGSDDTKPTLGYPKNAFGWSMKIEVNIEAHVYGITIINLIANTGITWNTYNCVLSVDDSNTVGVDFYDREVTRTPNHRNIINERDVANSSQVPELMIEKLVEEEA